MKRCLLVAITCGLIAGCGSTASAATGFFDSSGTLEAGGWDMQLAKLSPDGTHLAAIGVNPSGMWVVGLASQGAITPLPLKLDGLVAEDLAWMPDSQRLLVATTKIGGTSTTEISCVTVSGSSCPGVVIAGEWHHTNRAGMDVSPDGTHLAVQGLPGSRDNDDFAKSLIYVMALDRPALIPMDAAANESRQYPVWIDNGHIACLSGSPATTGSPPMSARVVNLDITGSAAATLISPGGVSVDALGGNEAALIFHTSSRDSNNPLGMYEYSGGARPIRYLGAYSGDHPQLSGDGSFLMYSPTRSQNGNAVIATVQLT